MKKSISVLVLLVLVTVGSAFAQISLSAGGGVLFDHSRNNGFKVKEDGVNGSAGFNETNFGGFIFFDATYVEFDVAFAYGSWKSYAKNDFKDAEGEFVADLSVLQLNFALLGKYPIEVGGFTIFPLLGFNYNRVLSAKADGEDISEFVKLGDLAQIGLLGGIGADFNINNSLYVRAEGLFQIRFACKYQKDMKKLMDAGKTTLGLGPVIKVAVGYKF